ncbi:Ldh family oxidoreductase [Streptomyces phaeochromogenes]|uniref:Ldh family oxidoreductase n=1 Tax=Streptomyces phaeochromogenes TaxID=1923 RepID=UPI0036CE7F4D
MFLGRVRGRRPARSVTTPIRTKSGRLTRIRQARASGTPLPEGAAATEDGTPTTDPEKAVMPLPLGGAKGSGMSLAFELLTRLPDGRAAASPASRPQSAVCRWCSASAWEISRVAG